MAYQRGHKLVCVKVLIGFGDALGQRRDRHADIGGQRPAAGLETDAGVIGVVSRLPQPAAVLGTRGPLEILAAVIGGDFLHGFGLLLDSRGRAVKFEEQGRLFAQGGLAVAVDGDDRQLVQQFDARHRDPQLYGLDHGLYRCGQRREGANGAGDGFRQGIKPHREFGDDAQRAFGADHQPRQVVAGGRLAGTPAGLEGASVGQYHRHAQHVLAHGAVTHCIGARSPGRRHAAYTGVGARIDRKEQPGAVQGRIEGLARDSALHRRVKVMLTHGDDVVERRQIDADPALHRQQMAFQGCAGAEGDHRSEPAVAQGNDFGDFRRGFGEYHRIRRHWRIRGFILAVMQAHRCGYGKAGAEAGGERRGQLLRQRGAIGGGIHGYLRRWGCPTDSTPRLY